ncbi:MAG: putative toxin-antitoxin system toxin component, PIN family [Candidatus Methanoperedens sp.]|nr:putative toxin-antitoxin system toxin component, PIN family [Candidatus Methanoperedens sp.]
MLKIVFDTNVFVSALMSKGGNPALLLDRVRRSYTLFISKDILGELKDVISRDKFDYTETEVNTFVEAIISFADVVNPEIKIDAIKADPDDNKILECAVTSGASYIVSGDKHLLELKEYRKIKIITPKAALDLLK